MKRAREVVKELESDGWYLVRTKGSHGQFKHQTKKGTITCQVTGEIAKGTYHKIKKDAGL